ncbi:unnamed protein product [Brassica oleracea var. botrytis]
MIESETRENSYRKIEFFTHMDIALTEYMGKEERMTRNVFEL